MIPPGGVKVNHTSDGGKSLNEWKNTESPGLKDRSKRNLMPRNNGLANDTLYNNAKQDMVTLEKYMEDQS